MAEISTYLQNAILNATLRNTSYTSPTTVYVALYTSDPGVDDSGTEVSGGSYARQAITFAAPSLGNTSSDAEVTFPTATANWGTITHLAIKDASTGGNLLFFDELSTSIPVITGGTIKIQSGNAIVTIS